MPNLFIFGSYKIYFWSNEGSEPLHVHVSIKRASKMSAKFWILSDGDAQLANNHAGFSNREIHALEKFIKVNASRIKKAWKNYFFVDEIKYLK